MFYLKLKSQPKILSILVLSILRSRAFFDDVRALTCTLRPIKQSIAALESQSCTLANCFFGLAKLGTAIKKYLIMIIALLYLHCSNKLYSERVTN